MINLKTLEAFFWIVELGGFRKAAEKLHTTQPAISARIAQLESELNIRLLDRNQGSTVPTAKGAELLIYVRRILDLHSEMLANIGEPAMTRGTIRIGAPEVIVWSWLPDLLADVARIYPLLNLEVALDTSPNLHVALLGSEIEMAFLNGPVKHPHIENVLLDSYGLSWVASPTLQITDPLTLESGLAGPIITVGRKTAGYVLVSGLLARADQRSIPIYSIDSLALAVKLVVTGVGIGVLPSDAIRAELDAGKLRTLQCEDKPGADMFTASYRKGPNMRVLAAVAHLASSHANLWKAARSEF